MEENKNLNECLCDEKAPEKRSFALLKKGTYSVSITVIVLAVIIAFNFLIGVIGEKVNLEFDMSKEKVSSITKENKEYLEKIEKQVNITFCADSYSYANGMMDSYAQEQNILGGTDYYKQTITLLSKYSDANDKININFVDTQDSAFAAVLAKYPDEEISYGDIIVSVGEGENERYQKLGFSDIYEIAYNQQAASYGYTMYNVTGSNLETKLTGAIEYSISGKTVNFLVLSGHSKKDYTEDYVSMLEENNYKVSKNDAPLITSISNEADVVIIAAPSVDFTPEEIKVLENFLDGGKGLIYFADATVPVLPNLSGFLKDWGIEVSEGILFETDANNYMPEMPTVMGMFPDEEDKITENMRIFCTGCNVPLSVVTPKDESITVNSLITSNDTVVNAPLGTSDGWTGYGDYETASYSGLIQSQKENDDKTSSFVFAFSSSEYIYSEWAQYDGFSNLNIALAVSERAGNVEDSGMSFVKKTITNESFAGSITQSSANVVRIIFVFLIPIATLALGIYIYIKRRNA